MHGEALLLHDLFVQESLEACMHQRWLSAIMLLLIALIGLTVDGEGSDVITLEEVKVAIVGPRLAV